MDPRPFRSFNIGFVSILSALFDDVASTRDVLSLVDRELNQFNPLAIIKNYRMTCDICIYIDSFGSRP